ncbi:MAG: hypothetical protein ACFFHD_01160 [Promethearchaeota archaeon]
MLFQDNYQYFGFWDAIEMGLYYVIVGYFILLFFYFLFIRFRTSKKLYWLYFSVLFLCLGIGRVFFIVYYFNAPELYTGSNDVEVVSFLMFNYRMATFFTWIGIACAVGVLGILLFPPDTEIDNSWTSIIDWFRNKNNIKRIIRLGLITIPVIIGILALTLSDNYFIDPDFLDNYNITIDPTVVNIGGWEYPLGRFLLNFIFLPIFVAIVPFIFIYLAWKTFGVLRKSYALNAIGFLLYFMGRISQGILDIADAPHVGAILPPLLILLALLLIVIANNYEQLK